MIAFEAACQQIFASVQPLALESLNVQLSDGAILGEAVFARRDNPDFDRSAMDGFACCSQDLPGTLGVIGELTPADLPPSQALEPGQAYRLFTGAPLPPGADCVVIQENATLDGQQVTVPQPAQPGKWIRPRGLDFWSDEQLIKAGEQMNPAKIALAITAGVTQVMARPVPLIGLMTTGDELSGGELKLGQIPNSNTPMLQALLGQRHQGHVSHSATVRDQVQAVADCVDAWIGDNLAPDLIISTGGASVGKYDVIRQYLEQNATELSVSKIAMRPGKPVLFGQVKGRHWLALPGNPVSAFVGGLIFGRGIARKLAGLDPMPPYKTATLGADVPANDSRLEFMRSRWVDGTLVPFERQDSSMLKTLARAQALVVRPADDPGMKAGQSVPYLDLS